MARKYTYTSVNELPAGAVSVREYCNRRGWKNVQNFYNYLSKGKLPEIELIMFCDMNYVIPATVKKD
jgi:hypothetical protein